MDMARSLANLETLYLQHRRGLYALALSVTRNESLAEDAIQTAFERMCRKGIDARDPTAYVFAAVRNAARDQLRRMRPPQELAADLFDPAPDPHGKLEADEASRQLMDWVNQLDEPSKELLIMRVYGELSFAQIASISDEPIQTVASRYRRLLNRMKERFTLLSESGR